MQMLNHVPDVPTNPQQHNQCAPDRIFPQRPQPCCRARAGSRLLCMDRLQYGPSSFLGGNEIPQAIPAGVGTGAGHAQGAWRVRVQVVRYSTTLPLGLCKPTQSSRRDLGARAEDHLEPQVTGSPGAAAGPWVGAILHQLPVPCQGPRTSLVCCRIGFCPPRGSAGVSTEPPGLSIVTKP